MIHVTGLCKLRVGKGRLLDPNAGICLASCGLYLDMKHLCMYVKLSIQLTVEIEPLTNVKILHSTVARYP